MHLHICTHMTSVIWMMNIKQHASGVPGGTMQATDQDTPQRTEVPTLLGRLGAAGSGWRSEMFYFCFGRCWENLGTFL